MLAGNKICGGVVIPADEGVHGVVQLLTLHAQGRVELDYYSHPYDVDTAANYDFLIVLTVAHFEDVIKFYDAKQHDVPLIVHVDTPDALAHFDHARAYPGIAVLSLPRAALDTTAPDVTLELNLVGKIEARLARSAHS